MILLCGACVKFGPYVDPEEPDAMSPGAGIFSGESGYFALNGKPEKTETDIEKVDSPGGSIDALNLTCDISFENFAGIAHAVINKDISLNQTKHRTGGMKQVSQTGDYEFWVMTHGVQSITGREFFSNFQVAIKHKASQLFMHALSDTSHSPEIQPEKSRISLVDYHPGTTLEKGELVFECRQKAIDLNSVNSRE